MATPQRIRALGLLLMVILVLGCGSSDGIKRVQVKGTVTVGGSEPFENGMVIFAPKAGGAKNLGGSAMTNQSGEFTLRHVKGQMGIEPGDYVVFFSKYLMPDGSEPPEDDEGEKTPREMGAVQFVPSEYASMQSTKYPVTVSETGGKFEFDIPKLEAPTKATGKKGR